MSDLALHFVFSFAIGGSLGAEIMPPSHACAIGAGIGLAKELTDDYISGSDMVANVAGACAGAYLIDWVVNK